MSLADNANVSVVFVAYVAALLMTIDVAVGAVISYVVLSRFDTAVFGFPAASVYFVAHICTDTPHAAVGFTVH